MRPTSPCSPRSRSCPPASARGPTAPATSPSPPRGRPPPGPPVASVGLGPVTLPPYLSRPEVATRIGPEEVAYAASDRWAAPLDELAVLALSEELRARLPAREVLRWPWPLGAPPEVAVSVVFLRFEADAAGGAHARRPAGPSRRAAGAPVTGETRHQRERGAGRRAGLGGGAGEGARGAGVRPRRGCAAAGRLTPLPGAPQPAGFVVCTGLARRPEATLKRIAAPFLLAAACLALAPAAARADGGMWMPQQMPDLAPRLKKLGFQGNPKAFADLTGMPMGAIVSLGGCSASFVSPDGLIITNHHCVTGALQYNATPERNTVKEGFLAPTPRGRGLGRPGLARPRHRRRARGHEGRGGQARRRPHRPAAAARHREARQGAHRRLREGGAALPRGLVLRGAPLVRDRGRRAEGRPARLRAALVDRQLRRRDRQLALAPPHRRLRLLPGLRGQGRQAGRLRQGQRPLQAQALPLGGPGRREPRRASWWWPATRAGPPATSPPAR